MTALEQYIADVKAATQGEPMKVALMGVASEVNKQSVEVGEQIAAVGPAVATATTKAAEASASADNAADSEVIATTQAGIATTKAAEAAASAAAAAAVTGVTGVTPEKIAIWDAKASTSVATETANGLMSSTDKVKVDGITGTNTGDETAATIKTKLGITTISGSNTGDQTIPTTLPASDVYAWAKAASKPTYSKSEVGLANVDNTSDASKPISTATQAALDAKASAAALSTLEYAKLSSYATNIDADKIYVNNEWKRPDGTTYCKSTLIGTTPTYNQIKIDYYDVAGTTIINTITWNLSYDSNGFPYQRVVV
jgi:hypothetical protein